MSLNEPPAKKRKIIDGGNEEKQPEEPLVKIAKKKAAKPYQCKAHGYIVGDFQLLNRVSCEFKALFGSNRLTIAWSNIESSDIRATMSGGFDFEGLKRAAGMIKSMDVFRVEIDIKNIDSIELSDGGVAIRMDIITNAPPIFTKQPAASGYGVRGKFAKSTDPTSGNAVKYRKHTILLQSKPSASNLKKTEDKLKAGSERLKQLFDGKLHKQFAHITQEDTHEQTDVLASNQENNKKAAVKKTKSKMKNQDVHGKKRKRKVINSDGSDTGNDDDDTEWVL